MQTRGALARAEPLVLGFALASPLPMLALARDGWATLVTVAVVSLPFLAAYGLYRLAVKGRPRPARRPALVPAPLGPAPAAMRAAPFRVLRRERAILEGTFEDVMAAARAGRLDSYDVVAGPGIEAGPAAFADLVVDVPSKWEARARRLYLGYLAAAALGGAAGIAVLAAARLSGSPPPSPLVVLLFAAALAPLASLRGEWRRLADGRAHGLVPEPPPRPTLGSAPLDEALGRAAPATRAVLAIVAAVSIAALLLPPDVLLLRLAKDNEAIRGGELWRLLTPALVHGGAFHLFMNGMVLLNLGTMVERLLGSRRMLAVLWGGVLSGSVASFATNPSPSVGISGGLFALVGALLAVGIRHRRALPPPARRMLVRAPIEIIVLNVALGLAVPIIDNAAHLGGLAGGVALGLALGLRPDLAATLRSPRGGAPA